MGAKNGEGLVDLAGEGLRRLDQVDELSIVHLKQHTSDLTGKVRLHLVDEREESLSDHVLLLHWVGSGKEGLGEVHLWVRGRSSDWGGDWYRYRGRSHWDWHWHLVAGLRSELDVAAWTSRAGLWREWRTHWGGEHWARLSLHWARDLLAWHTLLRTTSWRKHWCARKR